MVVAVAPHQVYGPGDLLFLPAVLDAAGKQRLRIFGDGKNMISFCHVDNIAHGLICGALSLYDDSPALGQFYIVTDGPAQNLWGVLGVAAEGMGFPSIHAKMHLPVWLMMTVANCVDILNWAFGLRLPPTTFAVRMMVIHRWFNIERATKDLKYTPVVTFEKGWADTIGWFKENWLPNWKINN